MWKQETNESQIYVKIKSSINIKKNFKLLSTADS